MRLQPDVVAVTGDIVEGRVEDLDGFLPVLAVLASAPLGAWYCFGNHDHFTGEPDRIRDLLASIRIGTLGNESRVLHGDHVDFVIGGIDDRTLGTPDWARLTDAHGPPHLLLAHNPDDFYEAERRGVAVMLSGHTHGGQIRFPAGPPIIRQSCFCLDEGLYVHGSTMLTVTRGLGAVGLPWRIGADPEAVLLNVRAMPSTRTQMRAKWIRRLPTGKITQIDDRLRQRIDHKLYAGAWDRLIIRRTFAHVGKIHPFNDDRDSSVLE
jgi:uncharacterized protein